jgi:hypothetical protein
MEVLYIAYRVNWTDGENNLCQVHIPTIAQYTGQYLNGPYSH